MRVKLILSGGAARGIAHIGVIKALEDLGFKIEALSGASAGSIVSVFYSYGYTPEEMLDIVKKTNWLSLFKPQLPVKGLFSFERAEKYFRNFIETERIEDLPKKVYLCAVDLIGARPIYFDMGELLPVLLGSCALPGIFEPVEYENYLLIDGGVMNNLPVEPFEKSKELKVGVDVNPIGEMKAKPTVVSILLRSFFLAVRSNVDKRKEMCDVVIVPDILEFSPLDVYRADDLYKLGYEKTIEVMRRYAGA